MTRKRWLALVAVLGLALAACGTTAATTTTAAPAPTTTAPAATTTTEAAPEFEGLSVAADNCDYGGTIFEIKANSPTQVTFSMCKPVPAFPEIVAFTSFGIQPAEHIEATRGSPLDNPIGTGPFVLDAWNRGDSIVFQANQDYWGTPPAFQTLVFRWATESAARLLELQSGNADIITNLATADIPAVEGDSNLTLLPDRNPNVFYLGMSTFQPPFDNPGVRQAIAQAIDRQQIVDAFYPEGSEVASHFTPCSILNGCQGEDWYAFDAAAAASTLSEAGVEPFDVTLYYRDVFRVYLPEPGAVANEIAQQLSDNLGLNVSVQVIESGEFIAESTAGNYPLYMLGWGADYPHVTNFLDFHFGEANPQFGATYPDIFNNLLEAAAIADPEASAPLYESANNAIKANVPMVPIAHGASLDAALASLEGAVTPVFGAPQFELMNPGKDTLVFVQNAEPISLYCADETDGESLSACQQVVEPLLGYDLEGGVVPKLATDCVSNDDGSIWTCQLREGVKFHDGSDFDANDVVASWAAGIDAANPLHVGNTGAFEYYTYLWTQLINAES
ncbi:MAG: ABC transporter substrate-binding protein [Actinomycetota bacterium]